MTIEYNTPINFFYDSDEMLWYTKIGVINKGILNKSGSLPLHYTVWGTSKSECRSRAKQLVTILYNAQTINKAILI